MTTSYFYSYIETSSYQTTYTITLKARQSRYSLTGEWWESNDGNNWYQVTSTTSRDRTSCWYGDPDWNCQYYTGVTCRPYSCTGPQSPIASQLITRLTANGRQIVGFNPPIILYFRANESVVVSAGITSYTLVGSSAYCYVTGGCPNNQCYWYCVQRVTEWGGTYKLQAIELVDWDTGEVYASLNQTSVTFNINANTIVRFKYVLVDSWSRTWEVILQPPPPTPNECQRILNDPSKVGSRDWCWCAWIYDPEAARKHCNPIDACFEIDVYPCCSGDERFACLDSWSGSRREICVRFTEEEARRGITKIISVGWSASWGLKPGWTLADIGKAGPGTCPDTRISGNSASGNCWIDARAQARYWTRVIVIFKKTQ
jgi:hypothetical protein